MFPIDRIDHIVVTTQNLDASIRFYVEILGLTLDTANGRFAYRTGRQKINVHCGKAEFRPAARNPQFGSSNFCLATDGDFGGYGDRLAAYGVPVIHGTTYARNGAKGAMQSIYVRDPDNNLVEIGAYGTDSGNEALALDHFVLDVADLDASSRFYETFLGMRCVRNGNACTASFANGKINFSTGEPSFAPAKENIFPGSGDFCLITKADINDVYAELLALQAPFDSDEGIVARTGATGPIASIYLRDPDGNLVEISAY